MFICAEHLTKQVTIGNQLLTILQDVSLNVDYGESLAIVGVSGSGKSTLLGLLAGLDLPTHGNIYFDGVDLTQLTENERAKLRAKNVGFVFQHFYLLPHLTAEENVMLPLELNNKEGAKERAKELLAQVGLSNRLEHYPKQLSGGEQQRVAIARAFAMRPRILLADEPTGNLDQKTAALVIDLLFNLNTHYQTTLVCVTHDVVLGERCKRVYHLTGGHLTK